MEQRTGLPEPAPERVNERFLLWLTAVLLLFGTSIA
jgi:hypothetical protein